jgi:hypothetical protein
MRIRREFEIDNLMSAFIGVRIDNILEILKALDINRDDEDWRSHFQDGPLLAPINSILEPEQEAPAPFGGRSSESHPETVFGQAESRQT